MRSSESDLVEPIRDASRRLVRQFGFLGPTLAGTALSASAVHALIEIGARRAVTASGLAQALGLEKSSVSRMLTKLAARGEIERGADGRAKKLSLTGQGRKTLAAIDAYARRQVSAALDHIPPGRRPAVLDGLRLYADALAGQGVAGETIGAGEMQDATVTALAGPVPVGRSGGLLAGKICLVTGATSGIGRATALRMAREKAAAVVVAGRRAALGAAVVAEIAGSGAESLFVAADVTKDADVAALVAAAMARFGRIDVVFNNAGFQERRAPVAEQTDEVYAQVFDTNVRALVHGLRHEIPALRAGGGGAIVNNTSVSGVRNPNPGLSLYSASKAAAIALTRAAAMEYAPQGIRINAVAPGRVVTEMMLGSGIADMRQVAAGLPLRRMGHPEEVAAAVCWLLSGEAGYIVGHVLAADGGFLAG